MKTLLWAIALSHIAVVWLLSAPLLILLPSTAAAQSASFFGFTDAPNASQVTASAVTCAATSTPLGVTANQYLSINLPAGGATVCFAWGPGATATLTPPSQCFAAGTTLAWGGGTGACIVATSTQAITLETK